VRHAAKRGGLGVGLMARILRQPRWLGGLFSSMVGFTLEAVALALAPVVLVQPLIVAELLFALPLAAHVGGLRLGRREWLGAVLVAGGLVVFVVVVRPTNPRFATSDASWVALVAVTAVSVAALVLVASRVHGVARTSTMAAAAAVALGLLAVPTKAAARDFELHRIHALTTWEPWAAAGAGIVGLTLAQNTFGAGPLAVSLPVIDVGEPVVASIISMAIFGEQVGALSIVSSSVLVASAVVVTGGVLMLDRSPLVKDAQHSLDPLHRSSGTTTVARQASRAGAVGGPDASLPDASSEPNGPYHEANETTCAWRT